MVDATPLPPVFIPNSEVRTLSSKSVGQEYRILVSLPSYPNYAESNEMYPVVYVLDPNILFGWVTDLIRLSASLRAIEYPTSSFVPPNLIVVGISYPATLQPKLAFSLRTRDQTPTNDPDIDKLWGGPSGGAENFLRFIRDELMPCINSNYRTDPTDSTIVGHSFGGLFALFVLFHEPDTFRRYVVSSPSLWWDEKITFQYESEYASKHKELLAKLFLSAGATEELESEKAHMTSNLKEFAEILRQRNYVGLELKSHVFEDEGHLSVQGPAVCKGISSVFSKSNTERTQHDLLR